MESLNSKTFSITLILSGRYTESKCKCWEFYRNLIIKHKSKFKCNIQKCIKIFVKNSKQ